MPVRGLKKLGRERVNVSCLKNLNREIKMAETESHFGDQWRKAANQNSSFSSKEETTWQQSPTPWLPTWQLANISLTLDYPTWQQAQDIAHPWQLANIYLTFWVLWPMRYRVSSQKRITRISFVFSPSIYIWEGCPSLEAKYRLET